MDRAFTIDRSFPFPPLHTAGLFICEQERVFFAPFADFVGQFYIQVKDLDDTVGVLHPIHTQLLYLDVDHLQQVACFPCSLGVPRPQKYSPWLAEGFATSNAWCEHLRAQRFADGELPNSLVNACPSIGSDGLPFPDEVMDICAHPDREEEFFALCASASSGVLPLPLLQDGASEEEDQSGFARIFASNELMELLDMQLREGEDNDDDEEEDDDESQ